MAAFQYNTITDAIDHIRSYDVHLKKLEEIKQGKNQSSSQRNQFTDPKLEESKVLINKNKLVNRHFKESEKLIGMKRETRALINRLQDIQNGKFSSLPEKRRVVQSSSMQTLHEPFRRQEEQRLIAENMKMLQRIIETRAQCSVHKMMQDYKKNIEYQRRMKKSSKNWDKIRLGKPGESSIMRLPPIQSANYSLSKSRDTNTIKSPADHQEKPQKEKKNILTKNAVHSSSSKQPGNKQQDTRQNIEEQPSSKKMEAKLLNSSIKSPSSQVQEKTQQTKKPEEGRVSPQPIESSPEIKPENQEEDVGVGDIAEYINEDFEA